MDDTWAGFAVAVLLAQIAGVFVHIPNPSEYAGQYKIIQIAACYVLATSFYTIVWSSRLSILFSIIRVHPDEQQRRRFRWIAALFIVVPVILICQLFWVCEPEPRWKYMLSPQCVLNKQVAICQLVSDVVADLVLLIAPLKLLSCIQDAGLRRRLMVIFSTCIVTTVVSLTHASYILTFGA
ncbi:hypothetical protein BDZ89DRAFT_1258385 [Hymenopellis radicata]|nr:hypothetical protein BDZ89DRAFT_1258385 [Hymenopellis radicata]